MARQRIAVFSASHRSQFQLFERWHALVDEPSLPLADLLQLRFGDENERDSTPRLHARRCAVARGRFIYFFFL
jgi:hypothetical protein